MSYTLVINNQNLVGTGNNTYQYNFLQGNFAIPEGTQMMVANVQIPYSFYNITAAYGNNTLIFNFPTGTSSYSSYTITIPDGFYTTTSLSNYLQQFFISNGFYLYNSTTAQNVYYLSLVYNSYQYGNQILASPVPTSLPAGYSLPSGYTSSTIFGGLGFPSTSRTPFIVLPFLSSSSTLGTFLGFGSYTQPTFLPPLTPQPVSITSGGASIVATVGSGAVITANITANAISSLTISNGGSNYTNPIINFSGGGGSGANITLITTNGVITGYNIISGGSAYASAPSTSITSSITSLTINSGGSNYTSTAVISFSGGGGSSASANPILTNGVLTGYTLISGGSGYTSVPTVNFSNPITATLTSGAVSALTINSGGSYTTTPNVVFVGGGGTGAAATVSLTGNTITGYTITSGGSNYTSPPTVVIVTNTAGAITANITGNVVTSLTISNGGSNYVNPSIIFSGGGGTGAQASLVVSNGVITGYNIISGGSGYTSAPTVTIVNNGGSYSGNSTLTPQGSTVNSIILRCSLVKNNVANPNDILDSFPISTGSAFGANINYSPAIPKWIKVSSGSFANFTITFCDQHLNLLAALDSNILVTLLLSFPDAKK